MTETIKTVEEEFYDHLYATADVVIEITEFCFDEDGKLIRDFDIKK